MNISIDNRYCNRFIHLGRPIFSGNRSGASVYNPDLIWQRACAYRCYTREPPVIQSATRVVSSLLDRSMLSLFHEPIMSPIIVFTSSPICLASKNSIAIDLITIKDRLLQHRRPAYIWYFSWFRWLCNDLSTPRAPENMSHKIFTTIHLSIWK